MYLYAVAIFNDIFRAALLSALAGAIMRCPHLITAFLHSQYFGVRGVILRRKGKLGHGNHKPVDSNQVRPPIRHAGDAVDISSSLEAIVWISNYGYSCRPRLPWILARL